MAVDDELKAQILRYHFVEHWRVPAAPAACLCFFDGAGGDHEAQSGLGVLDVPVGPHRRGRHDGDSCIWLSVHSFAPRFGGGDDGVCGAIGTCAVYGIAA